MRGGHRFQSRSLSVLSSTPICRCTVPAPACPHLLLTGCLFLRRTKRQVMTQLPAKRRQLVPLALAAAAPDTEVPGGGGLCRGAKSDFFYSRRVAGMGALARALNLRPEPQTGPQSQSRAGCIGQPRNLSDSIQAFNAYLLLVSPQNMFLCATTTAELLFLQPAVPRAPHQLWNRTPLCLPCHSHPIQLSIQVCFSAPQQWDASCATTTQQIFSLVPGPVPKNCLCCELHKRIYTPRSLHRRISFKQVGLNPTSERAISPARVDPPCPSGIPGVIALPRRF